MPEMIDESRLSSGSEPDLVAFSSSSILPLHSNVTYSYGPPLSSTASPSMSPEVEQSSRSLQGPDVVVVDDDNMMRTFSNRSRARSTSLAGSKQDGLPLYSAGAKDVSLSTKETPARYSHGREEEEDISDDDEEEDGSDLEMDTLNKNSQGRGGWKMLHLQDRDHPQLPASPTNHSGAGRIRRSSSNGHLRMNPEKPGISKQIKATPYSRFERFDTAEWVSMSTSLVLVTCLTVVALHICFWG